VVKIQVTVGKDNFSGFVTLFIAILLAGAKLSAQGNQWATIPPASPQDGFTLRPYTLVKPLSISALGDATTQAPNASVFGTSSGRGSNLPPLWFYNVPSSRDRNGYFGIMIGKDPFREGGSANVGTYIVPIVIKTHTVGVSFNSTTGDITSTPGLTVFDPTVPDNACMTAPNNVPATVLRQSPIFEKPGLCLAERM
jgi:hypothetical protein